MSVHGEYGRALEAVIVCLRATDHPDRDALVERFCEMRTSRCPDLSKAAESALAGLDLLAESVVLPSGATRMRDATEHLRGHCRAILGL